jgi:hypothetical protein
MSDSTDLSHFFAVIREGAQRTLQRVKVRQPLQRELTEFFDTQGEAFLDDDIQRVEFDPSFKPGADHLFAIDGFSMPDGFLTAARHPNQYGSLDINAHPAIKAVFSTHHDVEADTTTLYFQSFRAPRLLVGGFSLLQQDNNFHKLEEEGFTLDSKLVAAYMDGTLLFRSYSAVNAFLDLTEYFEEATDTEIAAVLSHPLLAVESEEAVLSMVDSSMRKKFAALQTTGILGKITARRTANKAKKFDLKFAVTRQGDKDAIVFPSNKKAAKQLLTFLLEGYYIGELTGGKFEAGSHRAMKV